MPHSSMLPMQHCKREYMKPRNQEKRSVWWKDLFLDYILLIQQPKCWINEENVLSMDGGDSGAWLSKMLSRGNWGYGRMNLFLFKAPVFLCQSPPPGSSERPETGRPGAPFQRSQRSEGGWERYVWQLVSSKHLRAACHQSAWIYSSVQASVFICLFHVCRKYVFKRGSYWSWSPEVSLSEHLRTNGCRSRSFCFDMSGHLNGAFYAFAPQSW